ncbi:Na-translocating system protein MpsC family protein [Trichococcus patagoniensis]|uniref:Na-translocating system protein MpsC family protein n=1 Tax=Trichococcus patagoniensis TaxID=382641 RepID=UPI000D3AEAD0
MRTALFGNVQVEFEAAIKSVIDIGVINTYSDISIKTAEKIIAIVVGRTIDKI